ncbi:hypothetical protein AB996_0332 [Lactococcus cremoris]|uniref:4'-phosphopantetheinyl transferase domain-containing protein n=1 Tax=Lactococcus lactis subsp. cremoris TaxID=1359 RepID=A0A166KJ67_LACLC|nr:4'-phosphopantetheinyl transferase family protein [Lactococcus cremoris]KZK08435.1 hypothetical protein AB996_0332 [Lactococcus cremoris]
MIASEILKSKYFYGEIIDINLQIDSNSSGLSSYLRKNQRKLQSSIAHKRLDSILQNKINNCIESSISHSGRYIFIGVSTSGKIGVDVEKIRYEKERVKLLSTEERKLVAEKKTNFTTLWTLKEAIFKSQYPRNKELRELIILSFTNNKVRVRFQNKFNFRWEEDCYYFTESKEDYIFSVVVFDK